MKNRFLPSFKQFEKSEKLADPKSTILEALSAMRRVSSIYEDPKDGSEQNPLKILESLAKMTYGVKKQEEVLKNYKKV
jgi:hypothetical protein